jgi:hypothetical protein
LLVRIDPETLQLHITLKPAGMHQPKTLPCPLAVQNASATQEAGKACHPWSWSQPASYKSNFDGPYEL